MQGYDLIIIGGGISGLGVAAEATARCLSPLVLEANTCCRATSNSSLRIIHGGFRYLQKLQIPRVIRSLNDQSYVFRAFRDAVEPLPCIMPLAPRGLKSRWPVTAAAITYGAIMKLCNSPIATPSVISARKLASIAPIVATRGAYGALCWNDVLMTKPERLAHHLSQAITTHGGEIREHSPVTAVTKNGGHFQVTTLSGETIASPKVINTLGPWLDSISIPTELKGRRPEWCKGFNVTIAKQIHPTHALGLQSPDGRLFFCVPRGSGTAIGTWYVPLPASLGSVSPEAPTVTEDELAQFARSFNTAFPEAAITLSDISGVEAGVLPMKRQTSTGPHLYGSEMIHAVNGYTEVISTKYTTFRSQARRALGSYS